MVPADFNLNGPNAPSLEGGITTNVDVLLNEEVRQPADDMAKLLMFHHCFGEIPFPRIQEMARERQLPKQIATCRIPTCSACLYSKGKR